MVKVLVLRTAGTNCDIETAHAFSRQKAEADLVHINKLKSGRIKLASYHILAIPGGFTYGDDIAAGRILANELRFNLREDILDFLKRGRLVIGICNGFQVLVKAGLLPDYESLKQKCSLILNDSGRFEDRWVYLQKTEHRKQSTENRTQKTEEDKCIWTRGIKDIIYLPVAHAEGKFIADKSLIDELSGNGQIVFKYVDKNGGDPSYPANPNGSQDDIAAICDKTGQILGMMPHPERFIYHQQHPHAQRLENRREGDGNEIFKNGIQYIQTHILKNRKA